MVRAFEAAKEELGYKSKDGIAKYFKELFPEEHPMPWCLPFIEWVFAKAYGKAQAEQMLCMENGFVYSVPAFLSLVKQKNRFYRRAVDPGWLVLLRTRKEWTNHVELVTEVTDEWVKTIGGNCCGEVKINTYRRDDPRISGYAKIIYRMEASECTA